MLRSYVRSITTKVWLWWNSAFHFLLTSNFIKCKIVHSCIAKVWQIIFKFFSALIEIPYCLKNIKVHISWINSRYIVYIRALFHQKHLHLQTIYFTSFAIYFTSYSKTPMKTIFYVMIMFCLNLFKLIPDHWQSLSS